MPRKAGKRSLRKFMMAFRAPATAPGLVTRSLRLGTLSLDPEVDADFDAEAVCTPGFSEAAARISGPSEAAILVGSFSMMSWRKEGRWA